MLDLYAVLEPGKAAAGISIGEPVARLLEIGHPSRTRLADEIELLDFGPVRVWARASVVDQIGVRGEYAGYITGTRIRIGSTIQQVIHAIGPVMEDQYDNLVVANVSGLCFETTEWRHAPDVGSIAENLDATLTEILVYAQAS